MGLVGLYLKRHLPERHMSMGSRDMIGAIMGLLSLLLALVLGILVGDAHQFFASPALRRVPSVFRGRARRTSRCPRLGPARLSSKPSPVGAPAF